MNEPPRTPRILLDFPREPRPAAPVRRVLESPTAVLRARHPGEVRDVIAAAERLARSGSLVAGFVSYDAAPSFDTALVAGGDPALPLAWFAAFESWREGDAPRAVADESPLAVTTTLDDTSYRRAVERVREYIAAGDVYQVNLTIPFTASPRVSLEDLYDRLRLAQAGRYSAFIDTGDVQVLSASPELFFARRGRTITCRPMKGTAPRAPTASGDVERREALLASGKDRAENVMIVDLVRNDIGRVAETGSVRVTGLCEAERFPRVWQLTSTVEGILSAQCGLAEIFSALFPSGSITGAPKIRATQVIAELEAAGREVYCGAVGVIEPGGDATFNVAIRTAWSADAGATVRLDAGGAVTIDSTPAGELAEARTKLDAFTRPPARGDLFETLRIEHGEPRRLGAHLDRLESSAGYFDIPFDRGEAEAVLREVARSAQWMQVGRGRLLLALDGAMSATVEPLGGPPGGEGPEAPSGPALPVSLARERVSSADVALYHKLADRRTYERLLAAGGDVFDVLLVNERGEVTEFTRGNLVVKLDGALVTPPISSGLLAGVRRDEVVREGRVTVRVITLADLARSTRLWFVNALRGWLPVALRR